MKEPADYLSIGFVVAMAVFVLAVTVLMFNL